MNPWPRRIFFLLIALVWLIIVSLPIFAFALAARSQLQIGSTEGNHLRIFLVQEKDAEGIGFELTRSDPIDYACAQTSVRYIMWEGNPEDVTYCQCRDPETGEALSAAQGKCSSR
jgi:hypothetical protein